MKSLFDYAVVINGKLLFECECGEVYDDINSFRIHLNGNHNKPVQQKGFEVK